ncbi:MAG: radical SAM protein [bacterium]|nr:radical SAM protein [bacterium]
MENLSGLYRLPGNTVTGLYGAGEAGSFIREILGLIRPDIRVTHYIDSFREGKKEGLPVIKAANIKTVNRPFDTILVASMAWEEIEKSLLASGIINYKIVAPELFLGVFRGNFRKWEHVKDDIKSNYLKCMISLERGHGKSDGNPILLTIEPTNVCNLGCSVCETGMGTLGRAKKTLSMQEFTAIIDQFDQNLAQMFFYFMGEPFINKHSYDMIRYAADRNIWVTTCTNGSFIKPEKLVDSGIGEINFQIAGMTPEVHEKYRVNSRLQDVLEAMEKTIEYREKSGAKGPRVVAGFILMKHNEHEADRFLQYCKDVGVDQYNLIGTTARSVEQAREYLPTDRSYWRFDAAELAKGNLVTNKPPGKKCGWVYSSTTVMANGDVVPCCFDPTGKHVLGNVFETDFYDIWNNEKYQTLRENVLDTEKKMKLCELCCVEDLVPLVRKY